MSSKRNLRRSDSLRDVSSSFISRLLQAALEHLPQPKLLHGVGALFLVAARCRSPVIGKRSRVISAALRPAWISDHLEASTNLVVPVVDGADRVVGTGFLSAACTKLGVEIAAEQIRRRRATVGKCLSLSRCRSVNRPSGRVKCRHGAFAAEVAEAADCGILLDLHNLLCNERNGRQSVTEFCSSIPLERVWEIDLACARSRGRLLGRCPFRAGATSP